MTPDPTEKGTALVTGGAKRIGAAIVMELAQHGYDVVIHHHTSGEAAEATADMVRAMGRQAWTLQADLTDPDQAESLLPKARDLAGPIRFVVNNASAFPRINLPSMTIHDVETMMRLHAYAPLLIARAAAPEADAIVNILDTRITSHDPQHFPYLLSKQTLDNLTRSLAKELAPTRVNGVAPGPILLPTDDGHDPEKALQKAVDATVLGRSGTPEEIAQAVRFLLEAEYITGDVLFVDGGRHLRT